MRWNGWEHIPLEIPDPDSRQGTRTVEAIAPVIVSASRSTDIPAFYGDWFSERLSAGYVTWKSPFDGSPVQVSFAKTRLFVFWSKNPAPLIPHLDTLDRSGYGYYFLFTLNDYDADGLEPRVPPLPKRIETFIRLSQRVGSGRVVWRFDPLVLSDTISVGVLLDRIRRIGDRIAPYTRRLIFSFIDIEKYQKVQRNLRSAGFTGVREFTEDEVVEFCEGLRSLNECWNFSITACADRRDLSHYGIGRGQCISYDLMTTEFADDPALMAFLSGDAQQTLAGAGSDSPDPSWRLKDPGQRNTCRCIVSKDIGQYSTCMHLCSYCYANSSPASAERNYRKNRELARSGIFPDSITL